MICGAPFASALGQPRVVKGSRPEENQVSRTSVSWTMSVELQLPQVVGVSRETVIPPQAFAVPCGDAMAPPELAGDAPVVDVGHPLEVDLFVHLRGEVDGGLCAVATASMAFCAMVLPPVLGVLLTARNHCMERRGSMTTPVRCERPMELVWSLTAIEEAGGFEVGDDALAGGVAVEAVVGRAGEIDVGGLVEDAGLRAGCGAGRWRSRWGRARA